MQHEKMLVLQEYQNQAQEGKIITEMVVALYPLKYGIRYFFFFFFCS